MTIKTVHANDINIYLIIQCSVYYIYIQDVNFILEPLSLRLLVNTYNDSQINQMFT